MSLVQSSRSAPDQRPGSPPLEVFPVRLSGMWAYFVAGITILAVAVFALFTTFALSMAFWFFQHPEEVVPSQVPGLLLFLTWSLILGTVLVLLAIRAFRITKLLGRKFLIYPEGLGLQRFRSFRLVPWNEIVALWHSIPNRPEINEQTRQQCCCWFKVRGGPLLYLNHLMIDRLAELVETMEKHTLPHLFAQFVAAIQAGDPVYLGRFRLDQHGIQAGSRRLPWSELEGFEFVRGGLFCLRRTGESKPWLQGRLSRVPNSHLFCFWVHRMLRKQGSQGAEPCPPMVALPPEEQAAEDRPIPATQVMAPRQEFSTRPKVPALPQLSEANPPRKHDPVWDRLDGLPLEALPELGKPVGEYRVTRRSWWRGLWHHCTVSWNRVLCLLVFLGWINVSLFAALRTPGDFDFGLMVGVLVFSWVLLSPLLGALWKDWYTGSGRLLLYPEGFVLIRGDHVTGYRWEQIYRWRWEEHPLRYLGPPPYLILALISASGQPLRLTGFIDGLGVLVGQLTTELRETFLDGEPVVFGDLVLHQSWLGCQGKRFSLGDLKLTVEKGALVVRRRSTSEIWLRLLLRNIPNPGLLLSLLTEHGHLPQEKQSSPLQV